MPDYPFRSRPPEVREKPDSSRLRPPALAGGRCQRPGTSDPGVTTPRSSVAYGVRRRYASGGSPLHEDLAVDEHNAELDQAVSASALLGYLNFSDGRPDPRWQKQLNDAYAFLAEHGEAAPWQALLDWLSASLRSLHAGGSAAFRDVTQAENILGLVGSVLPAYRCHHADLLAHLDDRDLFGPFLLARVCEAVLAQRAAGADEDAEAAVIARLNDFVGHRPIAILETRPQGEPYDHERHRPLPLYLKGAGVAYGPFRDLIARA